MLQPKKTKFRKAHKGRVKGVATSATTLNFGTFGLKSLQAERITARQIEAARVAMTRYMKRAGRVWVRIFPDIPVSKKPTEVRIRIVETLFPPCSFPPSDKLLMVRALQKFKKAPQIRFRI